jgi:translation initiation factor IF-3
MFRGREIVHPEIGQDILKRVAEALSDIALVESHARMEGRQMFMVIAPGKAKRQAPPGPPAPTPAPRGDGGPPRRSGPEITRVGAPSPSSDA